MDAQTLRVPGARLYYETRGAGPVLLLICGGITDAAIFTRMADALASDYTVVTYDRRGNSRSPLDGPPDDQSVAVDSDDAKYLLETVADGPACIFGSSSGAIIGLDLVSRHPQLVQKVVAHEPPMVEVLPDAAVWRSFFEEVYATYRRSGTDAAIRQFAAGVGLHNGGGPSPDAARSPEAAAIMSRMADNFDRFLAYEMRQVTRYLPDLSALDARRDRIVLAGGRDSRDDLPYRPAAWLAERFGVQVEDFPGDHTGYVRQPLDFAARLREVLA